MASITEEGPKFKNVEQREDGYKKLCFYLCMMNRMINLFLFMEEIRKYREWYDDRHTPAFLSSCLTITQYSNTEKTQ